MLDARESSAEYAEDRIERTAGLCGYCHYFFHILLLSKSLSFGQEQVYSCLALATLHYQMAMSLLKL